MSSTVTNAKTTARIVVTTGPDRGKSFQLGEELSHVGRGGDNTVVLTDPAVAEHQLSIVFRNGRYAVYTPLERSVDVDGNVIPHARWVWLPASARIRLSDKTALQFTVGGDAKASSERAAAKAKASPAPVVGEDSVTVEKRPDGTAPKKSKKKEQTVARFITDRQGEALVTLGEDGHLPELALTEGGDRASSRAEKKETNPLVIYGLVAMSLLVSLVLVLMDTDEERGGSEEKAVARAQIREFYGTDDGRLLPWQRQLREARLAYSRKDRAAERRAYRRVLDQLNSEDVNRLTGLTGSPEQDEKLRKLIGILLRE